MSQNTKIIVVGAAGRMGSTIVNLILDSSDFELVAVLERESQLSKISHLPCPAYSAPEEAFKAFQNSDTVVIDFTSPENTMNLAMLAKTYNISHIIGTTGLNEEEKQTLENLAKDNKIFFSPNMSVGINVLLKVLPELTKLLGEDYDVEMVELHHNKKKDSPSGTAIRLAECLADAKDWNLNEVANYHREGIIGERPKKEIGVQTIRGGDVVGVHTMYFMGAGERIEVTHQAHSRENFAQGSLRAARWITSQQPGTLYNMSHVLDSKNI